MSFILDALRKSEHERQRHRAPDIAAVRIAQPGSSRNRWLPLVALLFGINLSLLGVLWFTADRESASGPVRTTGPTPATAGC